MKYFFTFICLHFFQQNVVAQSALSFPLKKLPTNSFRNPLSTPFSLVGNFGECRPNHFHSGIDVRTDGKENKSVYAIEDGYISRVSVEAGGFGNAIYITHANGYTSVYAHLNKFSQELENYVIKKQYANQRWDLDLSFFPDQFWVRKGSFIAWSGNTGSSQGPHLHLEIRNAKTEAPQNPLLFFDEIVDDAKPIIKQLAIYNGQSSIYEQSPSMHKLSNRKLAKNLIEVNSNQIFFGVVADDYMKIATGTLGIFEMRLFVDNKPTFAWQMDNISYDITRYMNAHADYKTRKNGGPWIQLCTKLPNDKLTIYKTATASDGMVDLSDGNIKEIRIEVLDTKNNSTSISFSVKAKDTIGKKKCEHEFIAGQRNAFKNAHMAFVLNEDALYDHICFKPAIAQTPNPYSHLYQVHENFVPLHSYFDLFLTPKVNIPPALKNKVALVLRKKAAGIVSKKGIAVKMFNSQVVAHIREFGEYEIVVDQKAPVITSNIKNNMNIAKASALYFTVKEETTSIKNCKASVEGQWLRLVQKGSAYYYQFDDYFPKGNHQLTITAADENDNVATQTYNLIK